MKRCISLIAVLALATLTVPALARSDAAVPHAVFVREIASLATPQTPEGVRLSKDQIAKLRTIAAAHRDALKAFESGVADARENASSAADDVKKAVDKKQGDIEAINKQLDSLRAELDVLRKELEATKPGSPERTAARAKIDAKRAQVEALKSKKADTREDAGEKVDETRKAKDDAVKERTAAVRSRPDPAQYEAQMRGVLRLEQAKALDERIAAAKAAMELIESSTAE